MEFKEDHFRHNDRTAACMVAIREITRTNKNIYNIK